MVGHSRDERCAQTQDPGCTQMWPPPGLDQQLKGAAWGQPCH